MEAEARATYENLKGKTPIMLTSEKDHMMAIINGCLDIPPGILQEICTASTLVTFYYGEVSVVDAIRILHNVHNNMADKLSVMKAQRGGKGPSNASN
jgi:hypothetical protein